MRVSIRFSWIIVRAKRHPILVTGALVPCGGLTKEQGIVSAEGIVKAGEGRP